MMNFVLSWHFLGVVVSHVLRYALNDHVGLGILSLLSLHLDIVHGLILEDWRDVVV